MAYLTPNAMRDKVRALYPGEKWKRKVALMSDAQILAIYKKKVEEKKI